MNVPDFLEPNKWVLPVVSALAGGIVTNLVGNYRKRLRVLVYTVEHETVGFVG